MCEYDLDRYSYNRPRLYGLARECQFRVPEDELIVVEGKNWCVFHLPAQYKRNWQASHIKAFNEYINVHLEAAGTRKQLADLSGVVFPGKIHFGDRKHKVSLPATLFIRAIFLDDADFKNVVFEDFVMFDECCFHEQAFLWNVCYKDEASFNHAKLGGNVHLGASIFNNHAYFQGAEFPAMCWASHVVFKGRAWF